MYNFLASLLSVIRTGNIIINFINIEYIRFMNFKSFIFIASCLIIKNAQSQKGKCFKITTCLNILLISIYNST